MDHDSNSSGHTKGKDLTMVMLGGVPALTMMRGARREPYEPTPALWRDSDVESLANDPAL
jgi:hypothetical protein